MFNCGPAAKRIEYLRLRGFNFQPRDRVVIHDGGETPDTWRSTHDLEMACELQLQAILQGRSSEVVVAWEKCRTTLWQSDIRGQFGHMSSTRLLEFIASEI